MDATWQSSSEGTDDSDNEVRQSRRRPARAGAFTRDFLQANCADLGTDGALTSSLLWKMAERTRPGTPRESNVPKSQLAIPNTLLADLAKFLKVLDFIFSFSPFVF